MKCCSLLSNVTLLFHQALLMITCYMYSDWLTRWTWKAFEQSHVSSSSSNNLTSSATTQSVCSVSHQSADITHRGSQMPTDKLSENLSALMLTLHCHHLHTYTPPSHCHHYHHHLFIIAVNWAVDFNGSLITDDFGGVHTIDNILSISVASGVEKQVFT